MSRSAREGAPSGLSEEEEQELLAALPAHPTGTLAIVVLFGVIFALAWLGLYFGVFLPRGATMP